MTREELQNLNVKEPSPAVAAAVKAHWDGVAKPLDGLGRFEDLFCRIGAIQGTVHPAIDRRAVLILCADNGIVAEGVSQSGQEVTLAVAKNMGLRKSSVCRMAKQAGAEVIPVDVGINSDEEISGVLNRKIAHGTANFRVEPAMTEEEVLAAIETGISLVQDCKAQGYTLLATGEMGIGNTTTSAAVIMALTGLTAEEAVGRGAGLDDAGLQRKREVICEALAKYDCTDVFEILRCVGGLDIAALTGVFIGGAMYGVPIIIDGVISAAAALTAEELLPGVRRYALASHKGAEPAMREALRRLEGTAVIDGALALGEGTGAVMLFPLLDMAQAVYEESSSFGDIAVGQYERYQ